MTHSSNWRDELADTGTELLNVVERKVKASTTAATLVGLVLSVLSLYIFRGGPVPDVLHRRLPGEAHPTGDPVGPSARGSGYWARSGAWIPVDPLTPR